MISMKCSGHGGCYFTTRLDRLKRSYKLLEYSAKIDLPEPHFFFWPYPGPASSWRRWTPGSSVSNHRVSLWPIGLKAERSALADIPIENEQEQRKTVKPATDRQSISLSPRSLTHSVKAKKRKKRNTRKNESSELETFKSDIKNKGLVKIDLSKDKAVMKVELSFV